MFVAGIVLAVALAVLLGGSYLGARMVLTGPFRTPIDESPEYRRKVADFYGRHP